MDKTIRKFADCKKIAAEQQFKHVRLLNLTGDVICAYNPAHGKGSAMTLAKKFDEIERRLKSLEPGVYIMEYRARFSGNEPTYKYYVGNKNYDPNSISDAPILPPARKDKEPVSEKPTKEQHLLSVDKALEYATENARLTAEVETLRDKVTQLEREKRELEAELDAIEEDDGEENTVSDRLEKMGETWGKILLPVADRYMDLRERELRYKETKLLADAGYELPGFDRREKPRNGSRREAAEKDYNEHVPQPNDPDWENYLDWLNELTDRAFNKHLERVKAASQEVYDAVCKEFDVTFEEESDAGNND